MLFLAAHCILPKHGNPFKKLLPRDLLALFGAHNLTDPYETGRTALSPQKIQVHDDWNPYLDSFDADIAIVTFEAGAILFSSFVQPICLWNGKNDPIQTEGHIGGWGQSQNLENFFEEIPTKLKVPIHTNEFCFLTTKELVDLASNRTFCAGRGDGAGTCDGDSGGGVSIKVGSTFFFRGIVSSGLYDQTSCDVSKFSIFTDVLKFKPWIDQIMSQDGEISIPKAVQAVLRCTNESITWMYAIGLLLKDLLTCRIYDQKIDREGFSVADEPNLSVQGFIIKHNTEVNFLPENIAQSFPGLIAYSVSYCTIRTVNGDHFKGLNKLEILNLQHNEIESIDGDSFKELKKLKEFRLSYNKIKTIDPNLLQSLGSLDLFHISDNQIDFLDEQVFDNLQNLREFRLSENKLSTIPANLFKNNLKLKEIYLDDNKIQTISSTMFAHLKSLEYVFLEKNVCVNDAYYRSQFNEMKDVLRMNCTSQVKLRSLTVLTE